MAKKTSLGANSGCQFVFKKMALSVSQNYGQLSSCSISEKSNDPILTDGQTERQE